MATDKRQRQEQGRAIRRQELEAQRHKAKRRAKRNRYATIAGAVALILGLIWFVNRDGEDDRLATPTTVVGPTTTAGTESATTAPVTTAPATPATAPGLPDKPEVTIPEDTEPPSTLQTTDLVTGTGAEATEGSKVSVQYVGVSWSTTEQFDASWDRGAVPFPLTLGAGAVIRGWDQGLVGMRVGGRRQLVIPPDLAYGAEGRPPSIQPNDTLVFVVDLVSVD